MESQNTYLKFDQKEYDALIMKAKDAGAYYGIDSIEFEQACKNFKYYWLTRQADKEQQEREWEKKYPIWSRFVKLINYLYNLKHKNHGRTKNN